jgi:hypothetical protein
MKRPIYALSAFILVFFLVAVQCFSADRQIHAEWNRYVGPTGATVTGFKLYKEGVLACTFPGNDLVASDCTTDITKLDTSFTLTSTFSDGKESPQSPPYILRDYGPGPDGLKITVVTVRTVSSFTAKGNIVAKTTVTTKQVPADTIVNTKPINYWDSRKRQYISQTTLVM